MSGGASAWGIRSLADTFLRYFQPGLPVYLRYQNIEPPTVSGVNYAQLGFMPSVSGGQGGITDVLIDPPADVKEVSLHNIGILGGRLNFGARTFLISNLFVQNTMNAMGYTDPYQVWRDPAVMGLYYNNRLFSIESITHEEVGSETTLWNIIGNSSEFTSPSS
jgi:hypothetical protein